ncbi:hypothetical protein BHM03_00020428 [Ensete ventricosum]|nr:hypothetical protein BHM03_00020428 [Ensete ventricosum]
MDPSYPVTGICCWSGGARVRRRRLRSGRASAPAKRSGRVSSRRDPSDDQVSFVVYFSIPLPRRSAGAYIVGGVDHLYLATWLPLWLTMPSYTTTTPVVLAVVRPLGIRPYLCQVGRTTTGAPIPASDQLPASGRPRRRASCPRERGCGGQVIMCHIILSLSVKTFLRCPMRVLKIKSCA